MSTREPSPASDPVEVAARAIQKADEWESVARLWQAMAESDLRAVVEQTDYMLVRRCASCQGRAWRRPCVQCAGRGWSEEWGDEK